MLCYTSVDGASVYSPTVCGSHHVAFRPCPQTPHPSSRGQIYHHLGRTYDDSSIAPSITERLIELFFLRDCSLKSSIALHRRERVEGLPPGVHSRRCHWAQYKPPHSIPHRSRITRLVLCSGGTLQFSRDMATAGETARHFPCSRHPTDRPPTNITPSRTSLMLSRRGMPLSGTQELQLVGATSSGDAYSLRYKAPRQLHLAPITVEVCTGTLSSC